MAGETINEAYVSAGKPKVGGAIFVADTDATLPTSATATLASGFEGLGYCEESGVTQSRSSSTDSANAWGGDKVLITETDTEETTQFTLIEVMNINVLKEVFGADNVSGTLETGITIQSGADSHKARAWVIDMVLKNDALKRIVIPKGTVTEIGDVVYNDTDPIGYPITITAASDSSGNYHYEYIQAAGSSGT